MQQKDWQVLLDTKNSTGFVENGPTYDHGQKVPVAARSMVLLVCPHCFDTDGAA